MDLEKNGQQIISWNKQAQKNDQLIATTRAIYACYQYLLLPVIIKFLNKNIKK